MKKVIRNNVFETNSSSSHTLILSKVKSGKDIITSDTDELYMNGGEFGWGYDQLWSAKMKLQYVLTYFLNKLDDDMTIEDIMQEDFFKLLSDIVKEETGLKLCLGDKWFEDEFEFGYIDHESADMLGCFGDVYNKEFLRNIIFNKEIIIEIGNDNDYMDDHRDKELIKVLNNKELPKLK